MKYKIEISSKFKKDVKLIKKRGYALPQLKIVIDLLVEGKGLPSKYKDHALTGNYSGYRECHINPDWLLIYRVHEDILILALARTGTHSDLF